MALFMTACYDTSEVMAMRQWRVWLAVCLLGVGMIALGDRLGVWQRTYHAWELGIDELVSTHDENGNGIDDAHDLVLGARRYIESQPHYGSRYYAGGYPDDGYGVCTDVVWHAFAQAGYPLKELVDADVAAHAKEYGIAQPDGNIDFRRVSVLQVFFQRHARSLPTEDKTPSLWQPGDIVIYKEHIGICSDLRNAQGVPLLLHFDAFGARERDELWEQTVIAHYRWE